MQGNGAIQHEKGLTTAQAAAERKKYGRNIIPQRKVRWYAIALKQLKSAIVILMLVAAAISWMVHDLSGVMIIVTIIIVNTLVGFVQEFRAEKKLYKVSSLVQPTATIKRDGVFQILPREEVVNGDSVQLTPGTIVPADIDLTYADGLYIDESSITGESLPVEKIVGEKGRVEMGSVVTAGMGEGRVIAIGAQAVLGQIVNLAETDRPTNFEKEIRKLTELCIGIIVVTAMTLFIVKLAFNPSQALSIEFLIFILAIGIGILPESLPLITTVALSNGAVTLSKMGVVVRTLSAIQDMGSLTILCCDKTGTLTENMLSIADTLICDEKAFQEVCMIARSLRKSLHDPVQQELAKIKHAIDQQEENITLTHALPFDAAKRRAMFLVSFQGRELTVIQGAYETMATTKNVDAKEQMSIRMWIAEKEKRGERIFGIQMMEKNVEKIAGYLAVRDPIRSTAKKALQHAKNLGVLVKVVSGDSEAVTEAVTKDLGLLAQNARSISGAQWAKYSVSEKKNAAKEHNVFARFLPTQKHELIHMLQQQGEIVGYVGDGVNDAPSLKLADVGISVASGTDIAKNSSDIILLKKGLGVIVSGIQQGRSIFENISKYLRETLTENLGNFLSISLLSFFLPFLPMLPMQILVTNLLSDFPQLAIATDRVDVEAVRIPRRFQLKLLVRFMLTLSLISSGADMIFFSLFKLLPAALVQTGWFVFSTFTEILTIYSVRSRRSAFQGVSPSWLLACSSACVGIFVIAAVYTPAIGKVLRLVPLPPMMLGVLMLVVLLYFFVFDLVKAAIYRKWPQSY